MGEAQADSDVQRRLAAIMFLDMVGYSALMQESEARAQDAVDRLRDIARPLIAAHGGQEIRLFGDGMLLTFDGTVAAARCGMAILEQLAENNRQAHLNQRLQVRAGLHMGDIGFQDDQIFGDGVNIAARLVALAPPGAVTLSPHVRDQLNGILKAPLKSLGEKQLKNIAEPMEVFCLPGPACTPEDLETSAAADQAPARLWHFGQARFDERTRELSVGGQAVRLDERSLAILMHLLGHAGEVVGRAELREVAGGITDRSLGRAIERLREALRDGAQMQIRTHAGLGYRLTVPVSVEAAMTAPLTQFDFRPGDHPPLRPLWSLEKMLGQGGQGEVWLARHDKTGERRVYKFALDDDRLHSLKREITLSRALHSASDSTHFIRVLDWNLSRPPYFLETEFGGSQDLPGWADSAGGLKGVALRTRLELIAQVADALAAAHSVGVLHKDIKPANVLIQQADGQAPCVKLTDFGSGGVLDTNRLDEAGITQMGFTRSTLLATDSSAGTPMYFAPEVMAGQVATVQADVYALGVMLYQLVIGDLRRSLSTGWEKDVDDELLREDISAATQGDPLNRLADAASLARRLRDLENRREKRDAARLAAERARLAEQAAEEAQEKLERLRSRRRWSIAVVLSLCAGLALALQQQQTARAEARRAQAAEQQASRSAQEAQAVADFLSRDLFAVVGEKPLRDFSVRELLLAAGDNLDKRERQLPAVSAQLHTALGNALIAVEDISNAERHLDQALQHFEAAASADSVSTVAVAANLLHMQRRHMNRLPDLLPRFEGVLARGETTLGRTHPAVLGLREQLAIARFYAGQWLAAEADLRALVQDQLAINTSPIMLATSQRLLGQVLTENGKFEAAIETLGAAEKTLAALPGTPRTVMPLTQTLNLLADAHIQFGQLEQAAALLRRAEALAAPWVTDEDSGLLGWIRDMKGVLANASGEPDAAIKQHEQVLRSMIGTQWMQETDITFYVRLNLARAYFAAGRTSEAEAEARQALAICETTATPAHPDCQAIRIALAEFVLGASGPESAVAVLEQTSPETLSTLGADHPIQGAFLRVEGLIAQRQERAAHAQAALTQALSIVERRYGPDHRLANRLRAEMAAAKSIASGSHGPR